MLAVLGVVVLVGVLYVAGWLAVGILRLWVMKQ